MVIKRETFPAGTEQNVNFKKPSGLKLSENTIGKDRLTSGRRKRVLSLIKTQCQLSRFDFFPTPYG